MPKLIARTALIVVVLLIAYFAGWYVERFTLGSLPNGRFEATPVTPMAFVFGFLFTSFVVILVGSLLLNRYCKRQA